MNAGSIKTSERAQRLLQILMTYREGISGLEISRLLVCLNPATEISGLRQQGFEIECRFAGKTETGAKKYIYRLIGDVWAS